jgi:iron-sulfur cluster insertion protein
MVQLTDNAAEKIKDLMIEEGNPKLSLRMFVQGGGCSGFTYGFTFDEEQNDDDFVIEKNDIKMIIDAMSAQYLENATVDFKTEKFNQQFVISNPDAKHTCGCGSSFAV